MFHRFNERVRDAIERATKKAQDLNQPQVEPEHLLASLADAGDSSVHVLIGAFGVKPKEVEEAVGPLPTAPGRPPLSPLTPAFSEKSKRVLEFAVEEADRLGHKRIGTSHLMLGLLRDELEGEGGMNVLSSLGFTLDDVRERVKELREDEASAKQDVVPAILFFELDKRARDAETALKERLDKLDAEFRALRALVELATERIARLEGQVVANAGPVRPPTAGATGPGGTRREDRPPPGGGRGGGRPGGP